MIGDDHIPKDVPRRADIIHQSEEREAARLRRVGRGRKTGNNTPTFIDKYTRIFGETNIFKNLSTEGD